MKAITIIQPWAHLIAVGEKLIETRSWKTEYRGRISIHAGANKKFIDPQSRHYICDAHPFCDVLLSEGNVDPLKTMSIGAIVAVCDLVACEEISYETRGWRKGTTTWSLNDREIAFGDFTPGRYAWLLDNVVMLRNPIPARGALGIWNTAIGSKR